MIARLLVGALAVVSVVVAVRALRADHRCSQMKSAAYAAPAHELAAIARATPHRCGDPRDSAYALLELIGRRRQADAAILAREMTRVNPNDYLGWLLLGRIDGDRRALRRAHELNPRGVPAP